MLVPVEPARRARAELRPGAHVPSSHSPQDRLDEAIGLAQAIDLEVAEGLLVPLPKPRPGTLFGSGKVEEIKTLVAESEIELVVVDHRVSPIQQRNLEKEWNAKVLDRTGLILEIFGRRARTREGRLQVELAHLSYQKSRLVRSWTHLERQRGGAGFLGGPGERQLELDRRLIQNRIDALKAELEEVVRTRALHRAGRERVPYPIVAIVGYTNAGKSTLFNAITGAGVLAKDQVFATLDPTMREVRLDGGARFILSDTVGFISDLPTSLVAAFRATLEEVISADLVLHIRDISHPETGAQKLDVENVLRDLGVDPDKPDAAILEVWNKIDRLSPEAAEVVRNEQRRLPSAPVIVSAITREGLPELLAEIARRLSGLARDIDLSVPPHAGRLVNWLYENTSVLDRASDEDGATRLKIRIAPDRLGRLESKLRENGIPLPDA